LDYEFKLPDIGEGVAEGEVLKWMVKVGDKITEDQPLVEVMTDKVNVQIPAPRSGVVTKIMFKEGDVAKVGQTIVVINTEGVTAPSSAPPTSQRQAQPATQMAPASPQQQEGAGVLASPATRRLARELGVDIGSVKGTGPQGRVIDDDVRRASQDGTPRAVGAQAQALIAGQPDREELVPLRGIRKTIADRLLRSVQTTAQVTHVDEADATELVLLREELKPTAERKGVKLTYLPLLIKALIPALKEFPYANSAMDEQGGNIILKKYYNIGIATDTEQGLVVPVVKDADSKDVFALAAEIERLSAKARSGQLTLEEVRGSTFTVTNVGAIGGLFATPIVNIPEAAILGTHKITKRPVVRDGKIEASDTMFLSLTFDHRIFDGAYAARFTSRLIDTIQDRAKLRAALQ
jgi:pyruvate dehydrogenase E2 component (dihydrolipoamide acetyltransferase)